MWNRAYRPKKFLYVPDIKAHRLPTTIDKKEQI
jgi:hypothetical protein